MSLIRGAAKCAILKYDILQSKYKMIRCQRLLKLKSRVSCPRKRFDTGFCKAQNKRKETDQVPTIVQTKQSRETQPSTKRRENDQVTNQVPMIVKT